MNARRTFSILSAALLAGSCMVAQSTDANSTGKGAARDPIQSPAAVPRPKTVTPQTYSAGPIQAGALRFGVQCGFCHGRASAGGESGPDLTRSELVARDGKQFLLVGGGDSLYAFALP